MSFVVAAAAAVAFAPAAGPPKPIGPGVHIAGVDATGLDAEQARRMLERMYTKPLRFKLGDAASVAVGVSATEVGAWKGSANRCAPAPIAAPAFRS